MSAGGAEASTTGAARYPGPFAARFAMDDRRGAVRTEKPRILVVEDDYLIATKIELALIDAGMDVVGVAASADEALLLATAGRPDLAVMDIRLHGQRDGIDAALELYTRSGIRCLFATAHQDSGARARAEAAAPLGWLSKPYTSGAIVSAVERALCALGKRA